MSSFDENESPTRASNILNIINVISNIINSIIGVGIVFLPEAFKKGGIPFSIFISAFCCVLIFYTSDLMIKTAKSLEETKDIRIQTYAGLCQQTLGMWAFYLLATMNFLNMFCVMGVYSVLLRQETTRIISDLTGKAFLHDKLVLLGIMAPVFLLCLLRTMTKLGYFSFCSSLLVLSYIMIVVVKSPTYNKYMKGLTFERMRENEEKLDLERSGWICEKALGNAPFYAQTNQIASLDRVANYQSLYDHIADSGVCEKGGSEVLAAVDDFGEEILFENGAGAAVRWREVVGVAHANDLFRQNYLDPEGGFRITFSSLLAPIGTFSSAFLIQQCTFGIFQSLQRKTLKNWRIAQSIGFVSVYILCIGLALSGFLSQGYQVGETVFEKMKLRYFVSTGEIDYAINAGRIFLVLTIMLTFPLMHWFAKRNFNILFATALHKFTGREEDPVRLNAIFYYPITILLFVLVLFIGLFLDKISLAYSIVGALFGSPVIYILPCLCYLSANKSILKNLSEVFKSKNTLRIFLDAVLPLFVILFGICIFFLTTITGFISVFSK